MASKRFRRLLALFKYGRPKLHFSIDHDLCYFNWGSHKAYWPTHWMGTEKFPGKVPDELHNAVFEGFVQYGEDYYRRWLSFAFWKVKTSHLDQPLPVDLDNPLFQDYALAEGWSI
jgi:hypothetical protein